MRCKFLKFGGKALSTSVHYRAEYLFAQVGPVALGDTGSNTLSHDEIPREEVIRREFKGEKVK